MPEHQRVELTGDCALSGVDRHHQVLLDAFRSDRPIVVDLSRMGDIDVSFIQLIVASADTAARQHRSFRITGLPEAIETSFRRTGIDITPLSRPHSDDEVEPCRRS